MDRSASLNFPQPSGRETSMTDQFRTIAELHGDVAWIINCATGLPRYVSPAIVGLLGYDTADIITQLESERPDGTLAALCRGLPERLQRFADGDLSRKRIVRSFDMRHADGRVIPIEATSTIMTDEHGKAAWLVGTLRDVSAAREQAAQQKRFTSMLNHEFRTPLSTIDGAIQRLEVTGAEADEATRNRYRKIQAAVDRLIGMMDEYLSPERMSAVGNTRAADEAAPAALAQEAADLVRAAGRDVILDLGDLPASVRCQPNGLRLALKVLVDNALQYSPSSSPVRIGGQREEGGIALLVRDSGAGVPSAELDTIFGKRQRGSNALGKGSGLGLYMARSVIEVHGGTLSVRNVAPLGAEFRIWLPSQGGSGKSVASKVINSDNSAH